MWNYYGSVVRYGDKTTLRINLFGGPEKTHLAYEGIPKAYLDGEITGDERRDRRYNPLDYPNEIDEFFQPHYQLIHSWQVNDDLVFQNTFFYFAGDGYFQQYKSDRWFPEYGLEPFPGPDGELIDTTDLVRKREVDEWDGGWIPNLEWQHGGGRGSLQVGAAIRLHSGRHFGTVQWAQYYPPDLRARPPLLRLPAGQTDRPAVRPGELALQRQVESPRRSDLDLTQLRDARRQGDRRRFRHQLQLPAAPPRPRLPPEPSAGASTAMSRTGGREPAFRDIYDPQSYWTPPPQDLDPEELTDFELGGSYRWKTGAANLNLYYLDFDNAIVWAGGLDNNGDPVTANGAVTEHKGVELDVDWAPLPRWAGRLTLAYADNTIVDFTEFGYGGEIWDHSGNSLPMSPKWSGNLRGPWRRRSGRRLSPVPLRRRFLPRQHRGHAQVPRDQRRPRLHPPDQRGLPDLDLGLEVDFGRTVAELISARRVSMQLRVNNLTDQLFTTFGYFDGYQPVWIPAATRNGYVGLTFDW